MSEPEKKPQAKVTVYPGVCKLPFLPLCPLCGAAIKRGAIIVSTCPHGTEARLVVCATHLPSRALLITDHLVAELAARNLVLELRDRTRLAAGQPLASLRRPAVRTRLPPAANELGRFGFIDRLLGLLAELCVRVLNAGERAAARPDAAARAARIGRDPSRRGESEARMS